jgi:Ig-like domain CHU_C associated
MRHQYATRLLVFLLAIVAPAIVLAQSSSVIVDTYEPDASGIARPGTITFGIADCSLIQTQPTDVRTSTGQATLLLTLKSSATGATVKWYRGKKEGPSTLIGQGTSVTFSVSQNAEYFAVVTSADGACTSYSNTVFVTLCNPAAITDPVLNASPSDLKETTTTQSNAFLIEVAGDGLTYEWRQTRLTGTPPNFSEGAQTILGTTKNYSWTPQAHNAVAGEFYKISVTVTGSCGPPVTRTIAYMKVTAAECDTVIATSFPGEWPLYEPGQTTTIRIRMADPNAQYVFKWYIDDVITDLNVQSSGPDSSITLSNTSGVAVKVTAQKVGCADIETRTTYVWYVDSCPTPPIRLSQTYINLSDNNVNRQVIAHSDWPSVKFKWYRGDSGNTQSEIAADPNYLGGGAMIVPEEPGTYWVRVTSDWCGSTRDSETIVVASNSCSPVRISRPPQSADVPAGVPHTLSVDATGNPAPISYQWYSGIAPALTPLGRSRTQLVQPLRTTTYSVKVDNGCDVSTSALATLRVTSCSDIALASPPQSGSYLANVSVPLSVSATGNGVLHYQWYKGESGNTSVPVGTNSPSYTVTTTETEKYWVRIHFNDPNRCAIDSPAATITVCKSPVLANNLGNATSSEPGQEHWLVASASGTNLRFQWYQNSVSTANAIGIGRAVRVTPMVTTKYIVQVKSECAIQTDPDEGELTISVCPKIVTQPAAAQPRVMPGTGTTLSVSADGGSLTYQWYRGNTAIPGATSNQLNTGPLTEDTTFYVMVHSGMCERRSESVTVQICREPAIAWSAGVDKAYYGQSQILQVTVQPDAVRLWYYEGEKGDTSRLISGPTVNRGVNVAPTTTKKYWARADIEGSACYADTNTFTVNVCVPTITTHPVSQMIDKTQNQNAWATLTVAATGDSLTYQWYYGQKGNTANPVPGATSASLTVSPNSDTGYWARVSGNCGYTADSESAHITLCQAPVITTQPPSAVVSANAQVPLLVNATGTNLRYQWYKGAPGDTSTPIGQDANSISVSTNVTAQYWVRITGTCGSVNSAASMLSVAPAVSTLTDRKVTKNTTTTFTVTATGTFLSYQWYVAPETPISGATTSSYTTPPLTANTTVWVKVMSGQASASSNQATATVCVAKAISVSQPSNVSGSSVTLSVVNPDPNESYSWFRGNSGDTSVPLGDGIHKAVAPDVTTNYWFRSAGYGCYADSATVTVNVCVPRITSQPAGGMVNPSSTIRLSVSAVGTAPLTYQWYTSAGSAISGATGSYYDAPHATQSYYVRVSSPGTGCYVNSNTVSVTACQPVVITGQPQSTNTSRGGSATLSITDSGTNRSYQWYRGLVGDTSTPVGSNSAHLQLTNVQDTYDYWARISGSCGGPVNTNSAKVSVPPSLSAPYERFVSANQSATFTQTASGNQLSYQWYTGPSTLISGATGATLTTGPITMDTGFWVRVYSGNNYADSGVYTARVCKQKSVSVWQPSLQSGSQVTLTITDALSDESYAWYVNGAATGTGTSLTVSPTGTTTYVLRATRGSCSSDTNVTVTVCYPVITAQPQSIMVNHGQNATFTVAAQGSAPLSYQWYVGASGDTSRPLNYNSPTWTWAGADADASFWVRVFSTQGGSCHVNSAAATVTICKPPVITQHPQSAVIYNTDTVTLSVGATGTDLTYQWFERIGNVNHTISGATTNTFVVQPGGTRSFWVRVTGRCGHADSQLAVQSVRPTITSQPSNTSVCAGGTATFTIAATGTNVQYRWMEGSPGSYGPVIGLEPTLTVSNVTTARSFWCEVSSSAAWVYSSGASVSVTPGPNVSVSRTWAGWDMNFILTANVPSEEQPHVGYAWYQGTLGNTAQQIGGGPSVMVYASETTWYWVRVTNLQTGCWTDKAISAPY